jgi:hypothetical protein
MFTNYGNGINRSLMLLAGCLFVAFLLPFHFNPFRTFFNDWLAILGVVIVLAYYLEGKSVSIRLPWVALIPLCLAAAIALQVMLGMLSESWDAFLPIIYFAVAAIAIILGASISSREEGATKLCLALAGAHLFAALISVVIATMQFVGAEVPFAPFMMLMRHKAGIGIRPYANLGQVNHLALLYCAALASAWWFYQSGRIKAKVAIAMVLFLVWGLALTQSRIGWIIAPLFACVIYYWRGKVGVRSMSGWLLIGVGVLYAAQVMLMPSIASALNVTTESAAVHMFEGTGSDRIALYTQAWKLSLAHPWFGLGWFQFGPQQVMGGVDFPVSIYSQYVHNILLNFAAELGWPITITVFGLLALWLFRSFVFRSISIDVGFAGLFFIAVLVHSLVEYPLWYAMVLLPVALLIGMVHQAQLGSKEVGVSRWYIFPLVILMGVGLLGISMDFRRIVIGFNNLEFQAMGVKGVESDVQRPAFTAFPYMYDYLTFMRMTMHPQMSPEEIAFTERVSKRFGGYVVLSRMSQMYALNGREDDAVRMVLIIKRLHGPRYKEIYEDWRRAPAQVQNVFRRLPPPTPEQGLQTFKKQLL